MQVWALILKLNFWLSRACYALLGIRTFPSFSVLGDSKVIVDWVNEVHSIQSVDLHHWLGHVKQLIGFFNNLSFHHIYREFNKMADGLSKRAIGLVGGVIDWEELFEGSVIDSGQLSLHC